MPVANGRLTNLQLEILNMFQYEVPEEVILEVRRVLVRHLAEEVTKGMDELFEEKGWGEEKLEEWKNEHMRTPYIPE